MVKTELGHVIDALISKWPSIIGGSGFGSGYRKAHYNIVLHKGLDLSASLKEIEVAATHYFGLVPARHSYKIDRRPTMTILTITFYVP